MYDLGKARAKCLSDFCARHRTETLYAFDGGALRCMEDYRSAGKRAAVCKAFVDYVARRIIKRRARQSH